VGLYRHWDGEGAGEEEISRSPPGQPTTLAGDGLFLVSTEDLGFDTELKSSAIATDDESGVPFGEVTFSSPSTRSGALGSVCIRLLLPAGLPDHPCVPACAHSLSSALSSSESGGMSGECGKMTTLILFFFWYKI